MTEIKAQEEAVKLNTKIGKHYQVYLEGWKIGPKQINIKHGDKEYVLGSHKENIATMEQY